MSTATSTPAAQASPFAPAPRGWLLPALALLAAALAPLVLDRYYLEVMIVLLLYAYMGSAWDILGGWTGQFSFGHAAFFGFGAYTTALLLTKLGVTPWIGFIASGIVAALVGLLIGAATFRFGLKGHYFALGMFGIAEMCRVIVVNAKDLGGAVGIQIPYLGAKPAMMAFESKTAHYYVLLAMMVGVLAFVWSLRRSAFGYRLQAVREDEDAAEALGIDVFRIKMYAMAISAFFTGIAGAFYANYYQFIEPELVFGASKSIDGLICAVIGGAGTVYGPLLGALLLAPMAEMTKAMFRAYPGLDVVLYGTILIIFVRFIPHGIAGLLRGWWDRMRAGRS